jgi:hypothetical protein
MNFQINNILKNNIYTLKKTIYPDLLVQLTSRSKKQKDRKCSSQLVIFLDISVECGTKVTWTIFRNIKIGTSNAA